MYPLNVHHKDLRAYAVANDEAEHKELSKQGYEPKWEAPKKPAKEDGKKE